MQTCAREQLSVQTHILASWHEHQHWCHVSLARSRNFRIHQTDRSSSHPARSVSSHTFVLMCSCGFLLFRTPSAPAAGNSAACLPCCLLLLTLLFVSYAASAGANMRMRCAISWTHVLPMSVSQMDLDKRRNSMGRSRNKPQEASTATLHAIRRVSLTVLSLHARCCLPALLVHAALPVARHTLRWSATFRKSQVDVYG